MSGAGRRILWGFYMIIFFVFFNSRYADLPGEMRQIYWWTILLILIAMIFDKDVHRYFKPWEISIFKRGATERTIAALQAEYLQIANVDSPAANSRRIAIERHLTRLGSSLP